MRSRDKRFLGKAREWQVMCAQCHEKSKPVNGRSGMPPQILIKKFLQMGWIVGDNPKHDRCPTCIHKQIESHTAQAAKTLKDLQAPMVPVNGHRVHFSELKAAAAKLDAKSAKELISLLQQQIPKPIKKPKAESAPNLTPSEYDAWINEVPK